MTDEERKRFCETLRAWGSTPALTDPGSFSLLGRFVCDAATEIEHLAKALKEAKRHDMRDWYDALDRGRKNPI